MPVSLLPATGVLDLAVPVGDDALALAAVLLLQRLARLGLEDAAHLRGVKDLAFGQARIGHLARFRNGLALRRRRRVLLLHAFVAVLLSQALHRQLVGRLGFVVFRIALRSHLLP